MTVLTALKDDAVPFRAESTDRDNRICGAGWKSLPEGRKLMQRQKEWHRSER